MGGGNPSREATGAGCRGKRFGYFLATEKVTRLGRRNKDLQRTAGLGKQLGSWEQVIRYLRKFQHFVERYVHSLAMLLATPKGIWTDGSTDEAGSRCSLWSSKNM